MTGPRDSGPWGGSPLTIWIPRPREDAEPLALSLRELGFDALIAPVMAIRYADDAPDLTDIAAVLVTSANGARALARVTDRRDVKLIAVGVNSAAEAERLGFSGVEAAGGDVETLAAHVAERHDPSSGPLLHVAGSDRAGDLAGLLEDRGFTVRRQVLYQAESAEALPVAVADAVTRGTLDAVLLYSPRTARIVCNLLTRAGLAGSVDKVAAICLSENVAAAATLNWVKTTVADAPDGQSMLHAVRETLKPNKDDSTEPTAAAATMQEPEGAMTDAVKDEETSPATDAETVIDRFGGIRPMAQKLDVAVSTVQGWKTRNHIPENRWEEIQQVAAREGISLEGGADTPRPSVDPDGDAPAGETPETAPESRDGPDPSEQTQPAETAEDNPAEPQPDSPPPPVQQTVRRPSGTAWLALLVAFGTAGAVATQSYWRPGIDAALDSHLSQFFGPPPAAPTASPDPALVKSLSDLGDRLAALESKPAPEPPATVEVPEEAIRTAMQTVVDRVKALEDRAAVARQNAPETVDLAPLSGAIDALRARVDAMDSRADGSLEAFRAELETFADQFDSIRAGIEGVGDRLAAVERRLTQLESASGGPAGAEAAMVLAVGQLSDLIAASEPFGGALDDIAALAPNDDAVQAALSTLRPLSQSVIASRADLTRGFADIAALVDRAERVGDAQDWIGETLAELRSLVSIRRVDADVDAPAVSRAEAALAQNDLEAAVEAVVALAPTDPAIAGWVAKASQRVTVDDAIRALRALALARISSAAAGG